MILKNVFKNRTKLFTFEKYMINILGLKRIADFIQKIKNFKNISKGTYSKQQTCINNVKYVLNN